jgi:hypothetical protein
VGRNTWMSLGASVAAAGVLMLGAAYVTSDPVNAGQISCNPTPTPTLQPLTFGEGGRDVVMAGVQLPPTCTATPIRNVRTSTPTFTSTALPQTATPVPPTAAPPVNTPPPPPPSSGNEGVAVRPPNTGAGGSAGGGVSIWLLLLGAVAVAAGSGVVFVGVRRR